MNGYQKAFFRVLLVASFLGIVAGAFISIFPGNISEDWRTITTWNGNGGFYESLDVSAFPTSIVGRIGLIALLVVVLLVLVGVYVGLFLFWRYARLCNLLLTILFVLIAPWAGLVVLLPLEASIYDFTMLCDGAVIALSYTSPIKDHFERKRIA